MIIRRFVVVVVMLFLVAGAAPVAARNSQAGGGPQAETQKGTGVGSSSAVTLKVTVTISRWDGEKKVASAPYILMVVPSYGRNAEVGQDGEATSVQMGSETPVPTPSLVEGKQVATFQYRNLGTNISVMGRPVDDGKYNIYVSVQDSQLSPAPANTPGLGATPRYQTFRSQNRLTMRDGQTTQYAVATDTVTGQIVKLDVTMNVMK